MWWRYLSVEKYVNYAENTIKSLNDGLLHISQSCPVSWIRVFDIMFDTLARDNPRSVCITLVTETLAPLYVT